jgi:nucleoid-associated protein YgaU
MDVRVGVSFALSFLCVGVAAVALYQPDSAQESTAHSGQHETEPSTVVEAVADAPPTSGLAPSQSVDSREATTPLADSGAGRRATRLSPFPRPGDPKSMPARDSSRPTSRIVVAESPRPTPTTQPVTPRAAPRSSPKSAFTTVESGESLAAVALRVYGTEDALRDLWAANRDQLARFDDPLAAGTILRTP